MSCIKYKYKIDLWQIVQLAILFIIFKPGTIYSQRELHLVDSNHIYSHENTFSFYVDKENAFSANDLLDPNFINRFVPATEKDFNFGLNAAAIWQKFTIINDSGNRWLIKAGNPTIQELTLYYPDSLGKIDSTHLSFKQSIFSRQWKNNNYFMTLPFPNGKKQHFFIRYVSNHSLELKPQIATAETFFVSNHYEDIWAGVYLGLILVMVFYNFFIFISLRDKSYLFYVLYILCIGLIISMQNGYPFDLFWPDTPGLNAYIDVLTCSAGVFALFFTMHFLYTKMVAPRIHTGLYIAMGLYVIAGLLVLAGFTLAGSVAVEIAGGISTVFVLFAVIYIYRKGYKAARFYLLAWSFLIVGIFCFILNDLGFVNMKILNMNPMQIGSAIESLLLSFALADRFNMYKKEKEELVLKQNLILEKSVEERTSELSATLNNLRATQAQLLLHEKLASLGKMTSGIAHEIQNPMNFVNNFSELSKELVEEIRQTDSVEERSELLNELESNLDKISHHGKRADSIVKNMLMHSRADGKVKEWVDINNLCEEAFNFSYSGVKSKMKAFHCNIEKSFDLQIPKLNLIAQDVSRVILNLLNNAFYAVKDKQDSSVKLSTSCNGTTCRISIKDNGVGIPDSVKQKIFEPFFTTKPTGEGTGLGLSICYDIIKEHGGELLVNSKEGMFTEFVVIFTI